MALAIIWFALGSPLSQHTKERLLATAMKLKYGHFPLPLTADHYPTQRW